MKVKAIIRWVLCVLSFILALGCGSIFSGLLLVIAGILFMPIKQISERIKPPVNIILAVVLLVVGVMVSPSGAKSTATASASDTAASSAIAATSESTPEPTVTPEATVAPEPTDIPASSDSADSDSSSISLGTDEIAQLCEASIKDNYEHYSIDTSDSTITLNVWSDNIAVGSVYAKAGNEDALAAWNKLVDGHVSLCNSLVDLCETCGRDDIIVTVNVLNDQDLSKTLLTIMNGTVVYDAVNS